MASDLNRAKKLFREAQVYSKEGRLPVAISLMEEVITLSPSVGILRGSLASLYWEVDEFEKAFNEFQKAIKLEPSSEKISLLFFHFLWEQDKTDEAFEEIKRFMSISYSQDYDDIIKEILALD